MSAVALAPGGPAAPRLRPDLAIVEQVFRGETSFVVKDPATQKYFRFRPVEIGVMRCFDGIRSPDEIAASLAEQGLRLTARTVESFARTLASIGLLERTLVERTTLELERIRAERRKRRRSALFRGELLRMRWSLGDPDRMFDRVLPAIRWCFTPRFIAASVVLFAAYFIVLAATWTEFSRTVGELYSLSHLTFGSVVVLWLTALVVILIHELGHGFTCKYFGGEVHEMGFMLVYFQPAFYCNVNDAWSFPALRARLWVTAAGGWIQLVVASLAAIVWFVVQPGTLASEVAVAAMLVGGATTVLTNMNPLLPLDGYFALTDWLEIPNLRIRAQAYLGWWLRHHVLRLDLPEPQATERERRVFLIYAALAACYIGAIFAIIASWLLGKAQQAFGVIGVVLGLALIVLLARRAIVEWARSVVLAARARRAEREETRRRWPLYAGAGAITLLSILPWTLTTSGPFVVAPARSLTLTAPDSGIIDAVFVREGMRVAAGSPLARIIDRALERELLGALRAADSVTLAGSRARAAGSGALAQRLDAERASALARLSAVRARVEALTLRASWAGVVTTPRVEELIGQRVLAGEPVMRLAVLDSLEARVALGDAGAASVRPGQTVHLVAFGDPAHPISAPAVAVAPAGSGSRRNGAIEVRVPVRAGSAWRAGTTGEGSVELRRSTAMGALWWNIRRRVRSDVLL